MHLENKRPQTRGFEENWSCGGATGGGTTYFWRQLLSGGPDLIPSVRDPIQGG